MIDSGEEGEDEEDVGELEDGEEEEGEEEEDDEWHSPKRSRTSLQAAGARDSPKLLNDLIRPPLSFNSVYLSNFLILVAFSC